MAFIDFDIHELTLENVGVWPESVRYAAIVLCCVLLLLFGYWVDLSGVLSGLSQQQNTEKDLRAQLEFKQQQVVNLPAYKEQLEEMNSNFETMLRKLPGRTEIPGLLEDISKIGVTNGLQFKSFKPGAEKTLGFYAELPMSIEVVGSYHQLANFISQISSMDRIVTLGDFTMKLYSSVPGSDQSVKKDEKVQDQSELSLADEKLVMDITAKTYRYADEKAKDASK